MWTAFLERIPYIGVGVAVFGVFVVAGLVVRRVIHAAGERTRLDVILADMLGRLAAVVIAVLGALVSAVVVFPTFRPGDLLAGLGITSVAVGFAFKDVLQNFFAGILILWRKPFLIGDQIRFREYEGTIEAITVRSTRVKTFDGERAVIPNGEIYSNAVLVKTAYENRRVRLTVGIGYGDDIEQGRRAIQQVLDGTPGVLQSPGPWIYVSELAPSSVNFTVYFWTKPQQAEVLRLADEVTTKIKYALDKAGVDMPYPHTVVLIDQGSVTR